MTKQTGILIGLISLVVGAILGYFIYAQTSARFHTVTTACVMINQAIDNKLLTPEEAKQLGKLTGQELKSHYPAVANKLRISDQQADVASEGSQCSQFLVAIHETSK